MRQVQRRRSIARKLARFVRALLVVAMIVDAFFPAHAVAAVAASFGEHPAITHKDGGADHRDDGCPDDCAACPCRHLRCVPAAVSSVLEVAKLSSDPLPAATLGHHHVGSTHLDRLERPPRPVTRSSA